MDIDSLLKKYNAKCEAERNKVFTPKSLNYLNWRYKNNELQNYFLSSDKDHFVAVYLKYRGNYKELRVSEAIYDERVGKLKIKNFIKSISKEYKANFISYNTLVNDLFSWQLGGKFGPVLTLKNINLDSDLDNISKLDQWNYSLGDLELF